MCCGVFKAFGGLGAIVALILVIVALLKQLILLVGFLLTAVKVAIIVIFVALLVMIVLAILRERSRRIASTIITSSATKITMIATFTAVSRKPTSRMSCLSRATMTRINATIAPSPPNALKTPQHI